MKTLAPQIIPTREDIRKRFEKRLGNVSTLVSSLTALYAEQTEKLILELWLTNTVIEDKPPDVVCIAKTSNKSYARYYCPNCQRQNIYPSHSYCPTCGIEIKWI